MRRAPAVWRSGCSGWLPEHAGPYGPLVPACRLGRGSKQHTCSLAAEIRRYMIVAFRVAGPLAPD